MNRTNLFNNTPRFGETIYYLDENGRRKCSINQKKNDKLNSRDYVLHERPNTQGSCGGKWYIGEGEDDDKFEKSEEK